LRRRSLFSCERNAQKRFGDLKGDTPQHFSAHTIPAEFRQCRTEIFPISTDFRTELDPAFFRKYFTPKRNANGSSTAETFAFAQTLRLP